MNGAGTIRVYMMDLLPTVPYYTGHLCSALKSLPGVNVTVGSVTYHLDRGFFVRQGLETDPALVSVISRWRGLAGSLRRPLKLAEYLLNLTVLLGRFAASKPDIVHIQFLPTLSYGLPVELWFVRALRALGCKIVYTVHNVLPQDTGEKYRGRYAELYRLADRLICHDGKARERLLSEFHLNSERISVVAHGPLLSSEKTASNREARRRLGLPGDGAIVLWQGILRPYKGVPFLLKAWQKLHRAGVPARLVVVGNGAPGLVENVRAEVESLQIGSSVQLDLQFVPVDKLADYYNAADVLVYPYREITTSGALMTGLNYGRAIVATNLPAFAQLLRDGENALLVDYGDEDGLAARLKALVEDPALRARLGAEARNTNSSVAQWPEIAAQTAACYRAALTGAPPSAVEGGAESLESIA